MKRAMPEPKEERIYLAIKEYSPYKLEKRVGGLEILNTKTDTKEKPSSVIFSIFVHFVFALL